MKDKSVPGRWRLSRGSLPGLACAVYFLVILLFTLGKTHFAIPGVWHTENQKIRAIKPIPLDDLLRWDLVSAGIDYLGNTALFIPFGFLLTLWLSQAPFGRGLRIVSIKVVLLAALCTSLALEVLQFAFSVGRSDIDDLIFNTLGATLGWALARRVTKDSLKR